MHKFKKRYVTLIEMMIVMFLIALITGVIAYNYRGSLDEGKAFKTKAAIEKLETILNLWVADHPEDLDHMAQQWPKIVESSPLVQNKSALMKDGWGENYTVTVDNDHVIHIHSSKYDDYKKKTKTLFSDDK